MSGTTTSLRTPICCHANAEITRKTHRTRSKKASSGNDYVRHSPPVFQAVAFFIILGSVFLKRRTVGIGAFFCLLGTMHILEVLLGAAFVLKLPHGLISTGANVMVAGRLAFFLLLYIKEAAEAIRPPTYGLLAGNLLMLVLAGVFRIYGDPTSVLGLIPDRALLGEMVLFMLWGTMLLAIDVVLLVLLYEGLGFLVTNTLPGRMFITTTIVLSLDQLLFYAGLLLIVPVPLSLFLGGWVAKVAAATFLASCSPFICGSSSMMSCAFPREALGTCSIG